MIELARALAFGLCKACANIQVIHIHLVLLWLLLRVQMNEGGYMHGPIHRRPHFKFCVQTVVQAQFI